jgi:hypothetical protein
MVASCFTLFSDSLLVTLEILFTQWAAHRRKISDNYDSLWKTLGDED